MAVQHANRGIIKKDLQLYYNREFSKSFRGEATTNLIGTYGVGAANSYPSSGNNWGTYRDSLYNGGAFASIGTIASVSSNIITVSSPTAYFNSFATFDVITPQTTGGGLTANTNYYFKRLSATTFTLHQYDGTENASKTPEQVLTYINSDTRIAVNATSFPTMWWGPPHVPNCALIKTAITNGFAYDNRFHDCLRLNWFRSDRSDGMAYGTTPTYLANTQYAFSAYVRASSQNAIGGTINISAYQSGTATYPSITGSISPSLTSNWQKWVGTFTSSATGGTFYFYFFPQTLTLPATVDIAEMQLEQKSYATEFAVTSRSANTVAGGGGLLDLSGNNVNANLTNVLFNGNGYYFNGSTTSVDTGYSILNIDPSQSFSIEVVVNFDALTSYSPSTFTISNVNTTTNVITTNVNHNLVVGDRISFYVSGGSLPSPLLDGSNIAPYYIISPTTNTFKVSTSSGGSEVDITTAGSGTITALIPNKAGMLFGRANYGGIGIYYNVSPTNVVSIWGYSRTTAGYYNTPIVAISTGITYLITVVFDELNGRIYSLYINGVSQGSASCPSSAIYNNSTVGNFSIGEGGQADGGGTLVYNPFKGSCPMQRIYRRALTADEVLQNFNATRTTYGL